MPVDTAGFKDRRRFADLQKERLPQPFEGAPGKLVPADVQKGYADVIKALTEGKIELPKSQAHPCCT